MNYTHEKNEVAKRLAAAYQAQVEAQEAVKEAQERQQSILNRMAELGVTPETAGAEIARLEAEIEADVRSRYLQATNALSH